MAAPMFRSVCCIARKNCGINSRYVVFVNSHCYFGNKSEENHRDSDNSKQKSSDKNYLTYALSVGGALAFGWTLYKNNQIREYLVDKLCTVVPTIYAKSFFHNDISKNRESYNFIADVVEVSTPSVVYIEITRGKLGTTSNGSGFVVDADGLILTNAHVVVNKPNTLVKVRLHDGSVYTGKVEDVDLQSDLATVRIDKKNLPVMKLGNSADIRPGEFVVAIGSPLALSNTITSGVVSSANRLSTELGLAHKHMGYIQTDAAITFGNSGGPLVNLNGEAIGINAMKVTAGISFAIPIDYAKEFLKKAEARRNNKDVGTKSSGEHKRRYIGITMLTLSSDILHELQQRSTNIPHNVRHGVFVWNVMLGSPAHVGGLKAGDIITHVNSKTAMDSSNIYQALEASGALILTVLRNGEVLNVRVEPEDV